MKGPLFGGGAGNIHLAQIRILIGVVRISPLKSRISSQHSPHSRPKENYRKGHREEAISALSSPNEWVNRVRELDELYTKLQIITGFTVEQLLEMFAAGYTLEKPDYSKSFEEMASLAETTPPNEPLTLEELRKMDGEPVYLIVDDQYEPLKMWALIEVVETANCVILTNNLGGRNEYYDNDEMKDDGVTAYRRPPEGEVDV
jgi:hypothetical protein